MNCARHLHTHTLPNLRSTDSRTCAVYMTNDWLSHYKSALLTCSFSCKHKVSCIKKNYNGKAQTHTVGSTHSQTITPRPNFLIMFCRLFCVLFVLLLCLFVMHPITHNVSLKRQELKDFQYYVTNNNRKRGSRSNDQVTNSNKAYLNKVKVSFETYWQYKA